MLHNAASDQGLHCLHRPVCPILRANIVIFDIGILGGKEVSSQASSFSVACGKKRDWQKTSKHAARLLVSNGK